MTWSFNKAIKKTAMWDEFHECCEVVPFLDRNNPLSYENYGRYIYLSKSLDFINIDWCCQPTYQLANYQLANYQLANYQLANLPTILPTLSHHHHMILCRYITTNASSMGFRSGEYGGKYAY